MDDASIKLEAIARELANVIALINGEKQNQETFQFGESKLTIYRYHRANVIDPNSSHISEAIRESNPFALSLHLFLESTEFCLESRSGTLLSFKTKPESLVMTTGKELEVRLRVISISIYRVESSLNNYVGRNLIWLLFLI